MRNRTINVKGTEVAIATRHEQDYIALTDMVKKFERGQCPDRTVAEKQGYSVVPRCMGTAQQPGF